MSLPKGKDMTQVFTTRPNKAPLCGVRPESPLMHLLGPKIIEEEEVHSGRMGFEIMARGFFLRSMVLLLLLKKKILP